jgi:hypothetical protein
MEKYAPILKQHTHTRLQIISTLQWFSIVSGYFSEVGTYSAEYMYPYTEEVERFGFFLTVLA